MCFWLKFCNTYLKNVKENAFDELCEKGSSHYSVTQITFTYHYGWTDHIQPCSETSIMFCSQQYLLTDFWKRQETPKINKEIWVLNSNLFILEHFFSLPLQMSAVFEQLGFISDIEPVCQQPQTRIFTKSQHSRFCSRCRHRPKPTHLSTRLFQLMSFVCVLSCQTYMALSSYFFDEVLFWLATEHSLIVIKPFSRDLLQALTVHCDRLVFGKHGGLFD